MKLGEEPKGPRLIPVHRRRYCMVNPAGKPQFLYDEELPAFYVPSAPEIWIRLPEYLTTKLGLSRHIDGHAYIEGSDMRAAEEGLYRLHKKVEDLMVPLVRTKVIFYRLNEDKLEFSYSPRLLVEHVKPNDKSYWHMETFEGNKLSDSDGWDKPNNIVPWSPEAEDWFARVKKQIDELREFVYRAMYLPMDDGKQWRRIQSKDIQAMINNNTSPLPAAITRLMIEAPKEEKL
jgi:hypothetical protein